MMLKRLVTTFVCLGAATQVAMAAPVSRTPVTPQGTTTTPTLQQILDGLVVSGPAIDAAASQNVQLWTNTSVPMNAQVVADFTGKQSVKFGIYDENTPDKGVNLLADKMKPSEVATVTFNDDGSISVKGGMGGGKKKGFDGPFGFFAKVPASGSDIPFLFTQTDLNGGQVAAKIFQGNGQTILKFPGLAPGLFLTSQFLIAFETNKDGLFNDLIISVSGVAVPEPTFGLLSALSIAALCARRVRRT